MSPKLNNAKEWQHRVRSHRIVFDCLVLILLCALSQSAAFSQRMGRAKVYSDSYQYIAQAQSLINGESSPNFELRKLGYPLLLVALTRAFGQHMWVAVVANHILSALLPLAAYGVGALLRARPLGWLAAILVMARLQFTPFAEMMMSEILYMVLLSFGILAVFGSLLGKGRSLTLAATAGLLLGAAWFTRSAAIAPIFVVLIALLMSRPTIRYAVVSRAAAFLVPVLGFWVLECSFMYHFTGQFQTSHSAAGVNLFTARLCYVQGIKPPPTPAVRALQSLLPERTTDQAFRMNLTDQWVAMARAVRDRGLSSSEFGSLCAQAGWDSIRADVPAYLRSTLSLMGRHLLRAGNLDPPTWSQPTAHTAPVGLTTSYPSVFERTDWSGRWCLPQMTPQEGVEFARRIQAQANQRAPFDRFGILRGIRYACSWPSVVGLLGTMDCAARLWPGFALLLCSWLGLRRSICLLLAACYVGDALLHAVVIFTDYRYQSVWLVTDTVLAAAVPLLLVRRAVLFLQRRGFVPPLFVGLLGGSRVPEA